MTLIGSARRRRRVAVAAASIAAFIAFLDATIVNVAFPSIGAAFRDSSAAELAWILNAYNIVFAALLIPLGRIADRVGRRKLFLLGLLLFSVASILCAISISVEMLIAARILQAVGAAALVPASLAIVLPEYEPEKRSVAVAMLAAAAAVAAAFGPSAGGLLIQVGGWQLIFLVNLPLALVAAIFAVLAVRESHEKAAGDLPDPVGIVLLIVALSLLSLAIVKSNDWGWDSAETLGTIAASIGLFGAFVARLRTVKSPIVETRLLTFQPIAFANSASLVFAMAFFAKILCDILFLTEVWQYSVLKAGAAITPGPIITALTAGLGERLARRFGKSSVALLGTLIYTAGCVWYATVVGDQPSYLAEWLPGTVLTGVGIAFALPVLTSIAVSHVDDDRFATATALNATARQLGSVLGISLLIAILESVAGSPVQVFEAGWRFAAITAFASAVLIGVGIFLARLPSLRRAND